MSVLSQCHSIIFYLGISAPGHGKEVVDGLNDIDKHYMYKFMSTVQFKVNINVIGWYTSAESKRAVIDSGRMLKS